jgi:hypothetical protein
MHSFPHRLHLAQQIHHLFTGSAGCIVRCRFNHRPGFLLEQLQDAGRNEAGPAGIDMAVAVLGLLRDEETLRHHDLQMILRAGQRHIQQPPFFLDLVGAAGSQV